MGDFLLIWFPFIALILILFISNLASLTNSPKVLRTICGLLLFPAAASSIYLFNLMRGSLLVLQKSTTLIPLDIGILFTKSSAIVMLGSIFSLISLIFLMPNNRFVATIRLVSLLSLLLVLVALPIQWFLTAVFLSLGSIILSFAIIRKSEQRIIDSDLTSNFLWHRLSDIVMFISLMFILAQQKTLSLLLLPKSLSILSQNYLISFFIACTVRLIPISRKKSAEAFVYFRASFIEDAFVSLGIVLMLLRFQDSLFLSDNANYTLIIAALLIFIRTTTNKFDETYKIITILNSFLTCTALILMCFKQFFIVELLLLIMIIFVAGALIKVGKKKDLPARVDFGLQNTRDPLTIVGQLAQRLVSFLAETSANIISPFYTNFLMYRLPQLIITMFQIPLRIFHNGKIKRSLLFIMTTLATYYWLWGR